MAKYINPSIHNAALTALAAGNLMTVCSAQPTTRTEAVTTYALADVALTGGDYTQAAGDVSGRKVTIAAKADVLVDTTGSATHVAIVDATNVLAVTTVTAQTLTATNTVSIGTWQVEYRDPT